MTAAPAFERAVVVAEAAVGTLVPASLTVPIRTEVVDAIGHVLGNLFQRMQHLGDRTAEADPLLGDELRSAVGRLDDFLRVVLDYLSLRAIQPMELPLRTLIDALVQRLRMVLGTRARIDVDCAIEATLQLDPALVALGFDSFTKSLAVMRPAANPATTHLTAHQETVPGTSPPRFSAVIGVRFVKGVVSLSAEADVHRAVAQRVVELHGGTVALRHLPDGEVIWEMSLPCRA